MKRRNFLMSAGAMTLASSKIAAAADLVGQRQVIEARHEDTLISIAREHNLGFVELRLANPDVDPWLPGEGTPIELPLRRILPDAPREGLVINLTEMRTYFWPNGSSMPSSYPIGVGREGRTTPLGTTRIVRRAHRPTWYPPDSIRAERPDLPSVVPPGPENPLGEHALYFHWPAYLMHGTNQPDGIGRRVSAGCIRMYPEDIAYLYEEVPDNTQVTVVDQEVKVGWHQDELYLEVNPSLSQSDQIEQNGSFEHELPEGLEDIIREKAGDQMDRVALDDARRIGLHRPGYPIRITS